MNTPPTRLEYILLITVILCPSFLVAGWYLIDSAADGNKIALVILVVIAVLLINLFSNLSTLIAIIANQKQDNQVLMNARRTQEDALLAAKTLTQMQRAEAERYKYLPKITSILPPQSPALPEPETIYLESGSEVIDGLVE